MTSDDAHTDGHGRTTLVSNGPFRVESCPCGTLHVTIGVVTIRLVPAAFESLTETLLHAVHRLPLPTTTTTH